MDCLDETTTLEFIEGQLSAADEARVKAHLDTCEECRALVSELTKSMRGAPPSSNNPSSAELRAANGNQEAAARDVRGRTIGRYVVLKVIGAGAMGVVYSAYDPELDRKVALKLLHAQIAPGGDPSRVQRRLLREAQAMARLSHEYVVAVYDAGTLKAESTIDLDGARTTSANDATLDRVFVAMELVDGMSLGAWLKIEPRRWNEVLVAYVRAGRGLAAAHEASLVHRDFKPENVLVGRDGRVRVTDFGLARRVERPRGSKSSIDVRAGSQASLPVLPPAAPSITDLAQAGFIAGTPAYMAPEQLLAEVADARSDQFSFCVALYEGLYGERPFAGESYDDLVDAVINGEIREAPKDTRVPTWLRRVILRGLRVKADERYASMSELLAALEQKSWKVRRRVLIPAAIVATILAAILGYRAARREQAAACVGADARVAIAWNDTRRAEMTRAFAATKTSYANDSAKRASMLLDEYAARWSKMRVDACETTRVKSGATEEMLADRVDCLNDRLAKTSALVSLFTQADAKVVEHAVEAVQTLPTLDACANPEALSSGLRPPPEARSAEIAAKIRESVARVTALEHAGKYAEALPLAKTTVTEARALEYLPVEAEALYAEGRVQGQLEDLKAAQETLSEAAAVAEAASHHEVAAHAWIDLAYYVGYRQAQGERGHRWLRYAQAAIERLGGNDVLEAEREGRLGLVLWSEGKYDDALASLERARALFEKKVGPKHVLVSRVLDGISLVYFDEGRYDEALSFNARAREIAEETLGPSHPEIAIILNNMANAQWKLGRYDEALAALARSLDIAERTLGADHPDLFLPIDTRGGVLTSMGRYDESLVELNRASGILNRNDKRETPDYAAVLNDIGDALAGKEQYAAAIDAHKHALAILEKVDGGERTDIAMTHHGIARVHLAQGDYDAALAEDTLALPIVEALLGANTGLVLTGMGEAELGRKDAATAVKALDRALSIFAKRPSEPRDLAQAKFALARALWDADGGDRARALALAREARAVYAAKSWFKRPLERVDTWLAAHRSAS